MKRALLSLAVLFALVCAVAVEPTGVVLGWLRGEAFFEGRPTSAWSRDLRSTDPERQLAGLEQLSGGGSEAIAVLSELVTARGGSRWQAAEVRWRAAEILGGMGPAAEPAIPVLMQGLKDEDPHVRAVVAMALPAAGAPAGEAVPALTELLDTDIRLAASRALSEYGPQAQPALEKLVGILSDKGFDSEIRWNAARTLGKLRTAGLDALPVLVEHLQDGEPTVREHAAEAIGDLGPEARSAVPDLVGVLTDSYTRVRRDAVRSLGYIGTDARSALPAIEPLLQDPEQIVRQAAENAWKAIAPGEPLPEREAPAKESE